jgi:hypothetical protein
MTARRDAAPLSALLRPSAEEKQGARFVSVRPGDPQGYPLIPGGDQRIDAGTVSGAVPASPDRVSHIAPGARKRTRNMKESAVPPSADIGSGSASPRAPGTS